MTRVPVLFRLRVKVHLSKRIHAPVESVFKKSMKHVGFQNLKENSSGLLGPTLARNWRWELSSTRKSQDRTLRTGHRADPQRRGTRRGLAQRRWTPGHNHKISGALVWAFLRPQFQPDFSWLLCGDSGLAGLCQQCLWSLPAHGEGPSTGRNKFVVGTESQRGQEHQGFTKHRGVHTAGNPCAWLGRRAALAPLNVPRKGQKACQRKPRNVTFHNRQELKQPKCSLPGDRKPKGATSEHQTLLGEDGRGRGHRPPA